MSLIDDLIEGTEFQKNYLRDIRKKYLTAFDKYKTNVDYGIKKETPERHQFIVDWYEGLLNLDKRSFENIPEEIKYYL